MNRKHAFVPDEYYHLYNRGVDKRIIFFDTHDYHRFMLLLYFCNSRESADLQKVFRECPAQTEFSDIFKFAKGKPLVAIGAWCLMPNHFHILIREVSEKGIIKFMQKLTTGYSMYFNKKYDRTGSLFQGKFKSENPNNDNYLKYLFSYIHLNPVKLIPGESKWKENGLKNKIKTQKFLDNYEYSSLNNYVKTEYKYENIINKKEFPEYFLSAKESNQEISEWLNYGDPNLEAVKVRPSQG